MRRGMVLLAAGMVWAFSLRSQVMSQKAGEEIFAGGRMSKDRPGQSINSTLPLKAHTFEDCKRAAETFVKNVPKIYYNVLNQEEQGASKRKYLSDLCQRSKVSQWAIFYSGEDKPYEYEFLFKAGELRFLSVKVNANTCKISNAAGPGMHYNETLDIWKKIFLNYKGYVADFESASLRRKELNDKGIRLKKDFQLYRFGSEDDYLGGDDYFDEDEYVVFEREDTGQIIPLLLMRTLIDITEPLDSIKVEFERAKSEKGKKDQKQVEQKTEQQKDWLSELPPSVAEAWRKGEKLSPEDCIIIGKVIEVKNTPDDDYYFTQVRVAVEQVVWGKLERGQEKVVLLKFISGDISQKRLSRARGKFNASDRIRLGDDTDPRLNLTGYKVGKRMALELTKFPWPLREFYFRSSNLLPIGINITDIKRCNGYYEPYGKVDVVGDSVDYGYERESLKQWIRETQEIEKAKNLKGRLLK